MTAITLTREQLAAMNPCGLTDRLALFGRRKKMDVRQALKAGATVRDILWVAGRLGHRNLCVKFALVVAQRAAKFSTDPRVQACIDAANAYVLNPCHENLVKLRAARSPAAAAYAACAAADAAAAAYAAYAAAYAYAYAAAYAAACAAADAAKQEEIKAQHALLVEIFG